MTKNIKNNDFNNFLTITVIKFGCHTNQATRGSEHECLLTRLPWIWRFRRKCRATHLI